MANVLVTGASGLLGTEFCAQLKKNDNYVWALDNHSRSNTVPECDVWVNNDLNDPRPFDALPTNFDYIYHYGAINGTTNFYKYPNKVLTNNFVCDINVFNFATRCKNLKNLVYASSSEIVADDIISPVPENIDVLIKNIHNPRWSYRLAKITSENFLVNSELPWLILRYFNVYGKNSKQGHFVGDQINKIQNGTFSVIGANETRSFCYISDAVAASIHMALNSSKEVINIGNDAEVKIGDAVKIIAKHLGFPDAVFEELPSVQGSVSNRRPDITKLRKYMPMYNPISFDEGMQIILSKE